MKIKVKLQNKVVEHKIKLKYEEDNNYYKIICTNLRNEKMGYLTFKVENTSFSKKIWMYKIKTEEKFAHKGVGTALIYGLEHFAFKNNISFIEGKYYPENEAAVKFYEKYGYNVYIDGYEQYISKYIDKQTVQEKVESCITKQSNDFSK